MPGSGNTKKNAMMTFGNAVAEQCKVRKNLSKHFLKVLKQTPKIVPPTK